MTTTITPVSSLTYGMGGGLSVYDTNVAGSTLNAATINPYSVLTIPAYWRGIHLLANNLCAFPRSVRQNGMALKTPHRLDKIIKRRPNSYQNSTVFWKTFFFHACHYGNSYARINRNPDFSVESLHNLYPDDVLPFRFDQQQYLYVKSIKEIVHDSDILRLSTLSYDGMSGLNPVWMLRETFQRALQTDRFITRLLMKGTIIRGSIELPAGATEDQQADIVKNLRTYFSGADADRDLIVLSDGAKLNNATLSPQSAQMMEQTVYNTRQVAQILGVPMHFLMDDSEGKYVDNATAHGDSLVTYTFRPWIDQSQDEFSLKLLTEQEQDAGYSIYLDPAALLNGDIIAQATLAETLSKSGIISKNEARARVGYTASEDPEADALKVLGDTAPPVAEPTPAGEPVKSSTESLNAVTFSTLTFSTLLPVLSAACDRVDTKSAKAFENKSEKPQAERTIWCNVFADEQQRFAQEVLGPFANLLQLDVEKIANRYGGSIRKRGIDGTQTTLLDIIQGVQNEQQ